MASTFRTAHFSAKHRIVARVSRLMDNVVYTQRRGIIRGMRRRGGLGFVPEFLLPENTREEAFLRKLDIRDQVVYDIGAFQGLTTMWFSQTARQVITYEPNPNSYARVQENLRLNRIANVTLRPVAAGAQPGKLQLTVDPLMPGAASAAPGLSGQMRSSPSTYQTIEVSVVRIDDDILDSDLPQPDFIKIDIEGFELMALRGMADTLRKARPRVYMEMHGATPQEKSKNVAEIVRFMQGVDYGEILHVESGDSITFENATRAAQGHLFCCPT